MMPVYHVCAWCLSRPEEGVGSKRTGVTDIVCLPVGVEWSPGSPGGKRLDH